MKNALDPFFHHFDLITNKNHVFSLYLQILVLYDTDFFQNTVRRWNKTANTSDITVQGKKRKGQLSWRWAWLIGDWGNNGTMKWHISANCSETYNVADMSFSIVRT